MGGSQASTTAPLKGYDSTVRQGLRLNNNLTSAVIDMPLEVVGSDIDEMQRIARTEAIINALNSRQTERELSPEIAGLREGLTKQISDDFSGGPNAQLSNMWLKTGLQDAIATGANTDSGFARSALADSTRTDFIADRDRNQQKVAALLQDNPQPITGLDPGALATSASQAKQANRDNRGNYRSTILNLLGNQNNNVMNAFQQSSAMEMQRRANDTAAANSARAGGQSLFGSLAGGALGAAGAIGGGALVAF